ncbi:MAG: hypothetical protein ACRBN8_41690 [Nannocystales bacterium]
MVTGLRVMSVLGLSLSLFVGGCDDDPQDGGGDDGTTGAEQTGPSPTAGADGGGPGSGSGSTGGAAESGSETGAESASMGETGAAETSGDGGTTGEGETGAAEGSTGGEVAFDEEFIWVADFMLANCVACHATDANGMLLLPDATLGYEDVRLALDGVTANTGLLLVEPLDRNASQTYLQITNEFGAQFPVEDTDRFGAWIDAGAPYYAE